MTSKWPLVHLARVAEVGAVDGVLVAYGAIPKAALKHKTAYWASPAAKPKAK